MERIAKILDFVNSTSTNNEVKPNTEDIKPLPGNDDKMDKQEEICKNNLPIVNNDTLPSAPTEPAVKSTEPIEPIEPKDSNLYADNKKYNSIRRKLKKQQTFPCNINGKAYYTQEDVNNELKALADGKRAYNKQLKQNKLKNTKIEVNDLEELDNNEAVEDDGYIYTHTKPIGIVKDNKRYRLPTTNTTDRANIFNEIGNNKEVITKLLKTDNDNDFNEITLNNIHNENVKKRTQQHINNDIVKDNTWNKNEFIKLMERKMNEINKNNEDKMNRTNIPQPQRPITQYNSNMNSYNNMNGLNPLLFKKY